jgi:hypothetical protein
MKLLLLSPLPALLLSCQTTPIRQEPLPPVVRSSPADIRETSTRSIPEPEENDTEEDEIRPLDPDPVNIAPKKKVPRYDVPENVQPKVSDGINQGLFIELKW